MLASDFIKWWYSAGWKLRLSSTTTHVKRWVDYFSVDILLKTMFAPWRQNAFSARPGSGLQGKVRVFFDNLVSRMVGFFVRVSVLIAAFFTVIFVFIFNIVVFLIWPFIPISPILVVVIGASI